MPINIDELIEKARENCAYTYANVELDRHAMRRDIKNRHPSTAYFFSTEPKRHMSSLMYKAFVEGRGVTASEAAEKLKVSCVIHRNRSSGCKKLGCSDYRANMLVAFAKCDWEIEERHETWRLPI